MKFLFYSLLDILLWGLHLRNSLLFHMFNFNLARLQRISETLDFEIKRWAAGKEGNLRALLSTMQYVCIVVSLS